MRNDMQRRSSFQKKFLWATVIVVATTLQIAQAATVVGGRCCVAVGVCSPTMPNATEGAQCDMAQANTRLTTPPAEAVAGVGAPAPAPRQVVTQSCLNKANPASPECKTSATARPKCKTKEGVDVSCPSAATADTFPVDSNGKPRPR